MKQQAGAGQLDRPLAEPIVGYSLTYPVGVLVPLLAIAVVLRRHATAGGAAPLVTRTARVERGGRTLGSLRGQHGHAVTFGRVVRDEHEQLVAADELVLEPGDLVTVVAREDELDAVIAELGHASTHHISLDRAEVDFRRVFVSDARLAGRRLGDLDLAGDFDATVTRVRRGDVDFLATPDVVLELGDRVRVVAPRARLREVSRFFGDSTRALGEVDVLTLSAGLAAGLLLGSIPVPLPGGGTVTATVLASLAIGLRVLRLPPATLAGVVAGLHTQPAVLASAGSRFADDTEVNVG